MRIHSFVSNSVVLSTSTSRLSPTRSAAIAATSALIPWEQCHSLKGSYTNWIHAPQLPVPAFQKLVFGMSSHLACGTLLVQQIQVDWLVAEAEVNCMLPTVLQWLILRVLLLPYYLTADSTKLVKTHPLRILYIIHHLRLDSQLLKLHFRRWFTFWMLKYFSVDSLASAFGNHVPSVRWRIDKKR